MASRRVPSVSHHWKINTRKKISVLIDIYIRKNGKEHYSFLLCVCVCLEHYLSISGRTRDRQNVVSPFWRWCSIFTLKCKYCLWLALFGYILHFIIHWFFELIHRMWGRNEGGGVEGEGRRESKSHSCSIQFVCPLHSNGKCCEMWNVLKLKLSHFVRCWRFNSMGH